MEADRDHEVKRASDFEKLKRLVNGEAAVKAKVKGKRRKKKIPL